MIYKTNQDVINEIKAAAAREGLNLTAIAEKLGTSQQNLSGILHKKQLSFADVARIMDTLGYDLVFKGYKRQSIENTNQS